jgi:hypothetical protein
VKNTATIAGATSATLSDAFAKGDAVVCCVTPWDGFDEGMACETSPVVISNSPPSFDAAVLMPESPDSATSLTVECSGWFDVDGDPEGYRHHWRRNGEVLAGETGATLSFRRFVAGDSIVCRTTAWDGEEEGNTIETSATLVLQSTRARNWEQYGR